MGIHGAEQPPRSTSSGDELSFEVRARPDEVAVARRTVAQFLDARGLPRSMVEEAQLVASELVTNAVQHGRSGPIGVAVQVQPSVGVTLAVENSGPASAIPPVASWQPPPGLAPSGRGLGIVRSLSDEVEVRGDEDRAAVVWRRRWPNEEQTR